MINFDWKNPDYTGVFNERMRRLAWIREEPKTRLPPLKLHYKNDPIAFINDWGVTFDPRNADVEQPTIVPFLLFPKQEEWIRFVLRKWKQRRPGLTEKSRDCGVSWLAVALSCWLCLFHKGVNIGMGSRKEEYVDKIDSPKSLFYKVRKFLEYLPEEFSDGWNRKTDAPHMLIKFRNMESTITGEAGDGIGRGDRATIYFVDEAAHLERPLLVEASLSATTNCRIDISSVNGMANPFAVKRWAGKIEVFIFDWRDDPRKDDVWYAQQEEDLDPVSLAQEVNRDYAASVSGVLIPSAWVQSAIDAHVKLGIAPTGAHRGGLDIADEGVDTNAYAGVRGWLLEHMDEWSGKGDDIFGTVERAFMITDALGYPGFKFDSDGLGAGARGDARVINERRHAAGQRRQDVQPFRGSEAVYMPDAPANPKEKRESGRPPPRTNKDTYANRKAQAWWELRRRFQATHRAITASAPYEPDDLISISSTLPLLGKLMGELSQPTYSLNLAGKFIIDKAPEGMKSPNLADAVMIAYSRTSREPMRIDPEAVKKV